MNIALNLKNKYSKMNIQKLIIIILTATITTFLIKFTTAKSSIKINKQYVDNKYTNTSPKEKSDNIQETNGLNKSNLKQSKINTEKLKSKIKVVQYLDDITLKGLDGYDYWCQSSQDFITRLYAPRNYEILDEIEKNSSARYIVRIESSNKSGMPIVSNWSLLMKEEAGNWCVNILSKQ